MASILDCQAGKGSLDRFVIFDGLASKAFSSFGSGRLLFGGRLLVSDCFSFNAVLTGIFLTTATGILYFSSKYWAMAGPTVIAAWVWEKVNF